TVNGASTYRHGEYYQSPLAIANSSAAAYPAVTVVGSQGGNSQTLTGHEFLPKRPEIFGYDLDGNLTSDGRWTYTWDAENRLIMLVASTSYGAQNIQFEYDWRGRRIRKRVWNNTAGTGNPTLEQKFVYDGWNLIAILNSQS